MQPGDAVVALDLLLALGAFALKGGKYLSEIMPARQAGILPFLFEKE